MLRKRFENDSTSKGLTGFSYLNFDTMFMRKLDSIPFNYLFFFSSKALFASLEEKEREDFRKKKE
jgi:hypothetical protein